MKEFQRLLSLESYFFKCPIYKEKEYKNKIKVKEMNKNLLTVLSH